ncbi:MAG: GntR family transcriptional regulator [Clostridia bacterium]|nr:GntR family transcriptional regulator [Clostridia bacterium]
MEKYLSLKDYAYNYISEKISNGSLQAEERINEQDICNELHLSRTPVREALIQLASEGYVEKLPRKGFMVKKIDTKKASDLYTIIGALDGLAAFLAINRMTEDDLNRMEYLLEEMARSIKEHELDAYYQSQIAFHNVYVDKCNNSELIKLIHLYKNSFLRKAYISNENKDIFNILEHTNAEHKKILDLFKEKDAVKIREFLQNVHFTNFSIFYQSSITMDS